MPAHAKINVFLRVLGRRDDGYHDIETLLLPISLADHVRVEPAAELSVSVEGSAAAGLPRDDANLALRAARALAAETGGARPVGAHISIDKRIPVAAGLGG
ncbi:MAG TPA: 4-(cytidine 5'-diphospho)-2-C-methyl-D-erythritol kinase, partial [Actinomycetota bacterium]|nr:4-(cytidine 5'-diphospho)-2-C-methyl-D-erythritol kinase [Actinomycetota bacterium]